MEGDAELTKQYQKRPSDKQCPNCGYYKIAEVERRKYKRVECDYDGWRWWKDTVMRNKTIAFEDGLACRECGWKDTYDN